MRRVVATVGYTLVAATLLFLLQNAPLAVLASLSHASSWKTANENGWVPSVVAQVVSVAAYGITLFVSSSWLDHPRTWRLWWLPPSLAAGSFALVIAAVGVAEDAAQFTDPLSAFLVLVFTTALTGSLWVALVCPLAARVIPWNAKVRDPADAGTATPRGNPHLPRPE